MLKNPNIPRIGTATQPQGWPSPGFSEQHPCARSCSGTPRAAIGRGLFPVSLAPRASRLKPAPSSLQPPASSLPRSGFTLVELLVSVSIIAILATLFLGALYTAQDQARAIKTKSTIAKLNTILMARWESYKTRRVPITIAAGTNPNVAAKMRLDALHELMRMELPERFTDIIDAPVGVPRPSASIGFKRTLDNLTNESELYQGAECLYLIVTNSSNDDELGREVFGESEIADTDNDGLPEFVDAWGRPIRFLRWAPGFRSELQTGNSTQQPYQFDPRHVYPSAFGTSASGITPLSGTFALYPLIYSAGPDGKFGINSGEDGMQYKDANNYPFIQNGVSVVGTPEDLSGEGSSPGDNTWLDNIHNHLIGTR